jgi:hypothetical protein
MVAILLICPNGHMLEMIIGPKSSLTSVCLT